MDFKFFVHEKYNPQCLPNYLYHYTTKEGFLGIIGNRQFWATHILFQSDRSEFKLAFKILDSVIMDNSVLRNEWQGIPPEQFKGGKIFTASFSEKFDIRDQWDNYADSVPGYCIGFRTRELLRDFDCSSNKQIGYEGKSYAIISENAFDYRLCKCIYDENEQYLFVKNIVENIIERCEDTKKLRYDIYQSILKYAPMMKKRKYEEEQEWRFIITDIHDKSKIKERVGKYYFIPYFELAFKSPECIRDIYIGHCPELEREIIKDSTSYICYNHGKEFSLRRNGGIYFISDIIK
jgi:hypothetical protein